MKRVMLAGALLVAAGTTAFGDQLYWVVGNRATQRCDLVASNPVVFGLPAYDGGGPYTHWFSDGPYNSRDDAKPARSTIHVCPAEPDEPAGK
jgi:hypothetical protein